MLIRAPAKLSGRASSEEPDSVSRGIKAESAPGRRSRAGAAAEAQRHDRAAQRLSPSRADRDSGRKEGAAHKRAQRESADASGGSDRRKGSGDRRAVAVQTVPAASKEVPPGFDSGSASRQDEQRRRPGIGLIRSLVGAQTAAVPRADKDQSPAPKATLAAKSDAPPAETAQARKPIRRERKGHRADANGSSQKNAQADARLPSNDAQPDASHSQRQRKTAQKAKEGKGAINGAQKSKDASSRELSGAPPGLGPAEAGGSAAVESKKAGKGSGGQLGASRALKQALAPAYFEKPAKQQQPRE